MRTTSIIQEILKPRKDFPDTIPFNVKVFSDLIHIFNNLNCITDPNNSPIYLIHKGILECTFGGQTQDVCCINTIENYAITPIGIRIFDKDPGREYILAFVRSYSGDMGS